MISPFLFVRCETLSAICSLDRNLIARSAPYRPALRLSDFLFL